MKNLSLSFRLLVVSFFLISQANASTSKEIILPASFHFVNCGEEACRARISKLLKFEMSLTSATGSQKVYVGRIKKSIEDRSGDTAWLYGELVYIAKNDGTKSYFFNAKTFWNGEEVPFLNQIEISSGELLNLSKTRIHTDGARWAGKGFYYPELYINSALAKKKRPSQISWSAKND